MASFEERVEKLTAPYSELGEKAAKLRRQLAMHFLEQIAREDPSVLIEDLCGFRNKTTAAISSLS